MGDAAAQQRLGEAAGRGAEIDGRAAFDRDGELVERGFQLQPGARDIVGGRVVQCDLALGRHVEARLGDGLPVDLDVTAHDRVARTGAAGGKTAVADEDVEPDARQMLFFGGGHRQVMRPAAANGKHVRSRWRASA